MRVFGTQSTHLAENDVFFFLAFRKSYIYLRANARQIQSDFADYHFFSFLLFLLFLSLFAFKPILKSHRKYYNTQIWHTHIAQSNVIHSLNNATYENVKQETFIRYYRFCKTNIGLYHTHTHTNLNILRYACFVLKDIYENSFQLLNTKLNSLNKTNESRCEIIL